VGGKPVSGLIPTRNFPRKPLTDVVLEGMARGSYGRQIFDQKSNRRVPDAPNWPPAKRGSHPGFFFLNFLKSRKERTQGIKVGKIKNLPANQRSLSGGTFAKLVSRHCRHDRPNVTAIPLIIFWLHYRSQQTTYDRGRKKLKEDLKVGSFVPRSAIRTMATFKWSVKKETPVLENLSTPPVSHGVSDGRPGSSQGQSTFNITIPILFHRRGRAVPLGKRLKNRQARPRFLKPRSLKVDALGQFSLSKKGKPGHFSPPTKKSQSQRKITQKRYGQYGDFIRLHPRASVVIRRSICHPKRHVTSLCAFNEERTEKPILRPAAAIDFGRAPTTRRDKSQFAASFFSKPEGPNQKLFKQSRLGNQHPCV